MHPSCDPSCCPCWYPCCPRVTVGDTVTAAPGTDAQVQATCTPCGLRLDFAIPEGRPGASGSDVYASFFTFQQRFANGQPIHLFTAVADATGSIGQESSTRVTLAPGTYFVTYHISAVLEDAGYLQVTPAYNGAAHLEYGVYARTADPNVTVSGSNAFIAVVPEETVLTLNVNTSTATRDGAATLVILGLRTPEA